MTDNQTLALNFLKAFPTLTGPLRDHLHKMTGAQLIEQGLVDCLLAVTKSQTPTPGIVLTKIVLNNKKYYVNQETGYTYHRKQDESIGEWVGLFKKAGGPTKSPWIDTTVPEPDDSDEDNLKF